MKVFSGWKEIAKAVNQTMALMEVPKDCRMREKTESWCRYWAGENVIAAIRLPTTKADGKVVTTRARLRAWLVRVQEWRDANSKKDPPKDVTSVLGIARKHSAIGQ